MASIAFHVTMTDGTQMSRTASVSDADVGRIIGWALAYYPTEMDAEGQPLPKTPQWAVNRWIEAIVSSSFAKVAAYEEQQALAAAMATIPAPISVAIS